jgi:ribosomal protein S18 acetylase RimI-like enzyme
MITRGNVYHPEQLEGFVVEDGEEWFGLVIFFIKDHECEITSLDSLREWQGIGFTLIDKTLKEARARNCKRLFLISTNDNLRVLAFYQKRGFELVAVHRRAVNESRKRKPSIPLVGMNGIPLRDEIELEMKF